jgi:hypothetical protein
VHLSYLGEEEVSTLPTMISFDHHITYSRTNESPIGFFALANLSVDQFFAAEMSPVAPHDKTASSSV